MRKPATIPKTMMIYKVIQPKPLTEANVRQMGQKCFDMSSDAIYDSLTVFNTLKTSTKILNIYPDTGFFNFDLLMQEGEKYSTNRDDYPSDDECKKIAIEFLKNKGLFENNAVDPRVTEQMKSSGYINVGFDSLIGGYKTTGVGRRLRIGVGPGGTIKYVRKHWIEVEPWKMAPIKTPKEAFNELQEGKAFFMEIDVSKIDEITIRYNVQTYEEGYIQPVYYFSLKKSGGTYILVPAVKSEYIMSDE